MVLGKFYIFKYDYYCIYIKNITVQKYGHNTQLEIAHTRNDMVVSSVG